MGNGKEEHVWIFPSNVEYYDADYHFRKDGKINWYQVKNTNNIQSGDIVYIYFSKSIMEVHWKCIVGDVNFYLTVNDEDTHSSELTERFNEGPFIELIAQKEFDLTDALAYRQLKENGLKSRLMGPQRVDCVLYEYLLKIEEIDDSQERKEAYLSSLSLEKLKRLSEKKENKNVSQRKCISKTYVRSPYISYYAKLLAKGKCQLCKKDAPFVDKNGMPYLETHHVQWLSRKGVDTLNNVVALCPNCHKRMHIVDDNEDIKILTQVIEKRDLSK